MTFSPGQIVLVKFPFTDRSTRKARPAVVVSPATYHDKNGDIVLIAITTQPQDEVALELAHWKSAGLPRESWVKPVIGTLSDGLVLKEIGMLPPEDWFRVQAAISLAVISHDFTQPA